MNISLHLENQIINKVACEQIGGLLTQIIAPPGWVKFYQLNIWIFQNPKGSLHAIRFFRFPYVKSTFSHFLQHILIIWVQLV